MRFHDSSLPLTKPVRKKIMALYCCLLIAYVVLTGIPGCSVEHKHISQNTNIRQGHSMTIKAQGKIRPL